MSRCALSQRTNRTLYFSSLFILLQTITEDSDDLTKSFTSGVSCIQVNSGAGKWQAFTEVNFQGAQADLSPGQSYPTLADMKIGGPVKSIRKE